MPDAILTITLGSHVNTQIWTQESKPYSTYLFEIVYKTRGYSHTIEDGYSKTYSVAGVGEKLKGLQTICGELLVQAHDNTNSTEN